jgi:hypothetical protein
MTIPGQEITVLDPGLGLVGPATSIPIVVGVASAGPFNTIESFSSKNDLRDARGQGPGVETAAHILTVAGGPVLFCRISPSTAGTNGSVTKTPIGSSTGTITVAGVPNDSYEFVGRIKVTGDLGVAEFDYSLDDGRTFSQQIVVPLSGTFVVPDTGLTLTFVQGAGPVFFEAGDLHDFDSLASFYTVSDLDAAQTAILATPLAFNFVVYAGRPPDAATAVMLAAAIASDMLELENQFGYKAAIIDSGDDSEANWLTSFASFSDVRVNVCAGTSDRTSDKPIQGWGVPERPIVDDCAARAAASLISTDLGRFNDGALPGVVAISHDEFLTETLDAAGFTTTRTYPNTSGFYLTTGRIMAPAGSDFQLWQFRRVMDQACQTTVFAQQSFVNIGVRTNPPNVPNQGNVGTIDGRDATRLETGVESQLAAVLTEPLNAEGVPGHVSAFEYTISRTNNVVQSQQFQTEVAIQPLGYGKLITTQLGFTPALVVV